MTAEQIAAGLAKGWLAQSFLMPGRDLRDVPLCIRSRSSAGRILQETPDA